MKAQVLLPFSQTKLAYNKAKLRPKDLWVEIKHSTPKVKKSNGSRKMKKLKKLVHSDRKKQGDEFQKRAEPKR